MNILLTGAAGFIGSHVARAFLERGDTVVGLDNLNDYYSVDLKDARLSTLLAFERFGFRKVDIADPTSLAGAVDETTGIEVIVHLAAQAGVRYSIQNPHSYVRSNVAGQVSMFELAASLPSKPPVIYASSSSVYGANTKIPFAETDPVDHPVSVYAATKRAGELLAHAFGQTHGIASSGLRFFTVYGRYGRPDMAPWLFTDAILEGRPIDVFNSGEMERDFTHISDVATGVVAATDRIVGKPELTAPIYNLGNNTPVKLMDFIAAIEKSCGRKAILNLKPKPPGDVVRTFADIDFATRDLGYRPTTRIEEGMKDFVEWFRGYNGRR